MPTPLPSAASNFDHLDLNVPQFLQLVAYLDAHLDQIPFRFERIADDLGWPLEDVHSAFVVVQQVYRLFRHQEDFLAHQMNTAYLHPADQGKATEISMTVEQMQALVDLQFLTGKHPQSLVELQRIPRLHTLIVAFPQLFGQTTEGWVLTADAQAAVKQFQQYQKVHQIPKFIDSQKLKIQIDS